MAPLARWWTFVTECLSSLTLSEFNDYGNQHPIGNVDGHHVSNSAHQVGPPLVFQPPSSNIPGFQCDYTNMKGWKECNNKDRTCWLEEINGPGRFDITTDYENDGPIGIDRYITLVVSEGFVNADGVRSEAKLINGTFPGPLLEACWGDRVHVTVINKLRHNGTSIHWHGIRQLNSTQMDGVNGVTQCPIPPGHNFTYIWNATQFGSSWLHSHYSVQYADGVQAPITFHGPTSLQYDEAVAPIIMTDWAHNSAFDALYTGTADTPSLLLNGIGNVTRYNPNQKNTSAIPPIYSMNFTSGSKYLIRLLNSAYDTGLTFSIDQHDLWIVEADFVPVKPFKVESILVAIGQRYVIVVEAKPHKVAKDGNYWIRTYAACKGIYFQGNEASGYEKTGVVRYPGQGGWVEQDPTTHPVNPVFQECREDNTLLIPQSGWTVGEPKNGPLHNQHFSVVNSLAQGSNQVTQYGTAFLSLQRLTGLPTMSSLQVEYGNPMFLHLDDQSKDWPIGWMVVPEDYTSEDWAYIVLSGEIGPGSATTGPHPIHLHGHDFAILQTGYEPYDPEILDLHKDNPPRRDVVYLPNNGFVVIAFKTDNPGTWLVHCHIADHAAGGLGMQILERQTDAQKLWPHATSPAIKEAQDLCSAWDTWAYDCRNHWPGKIKDSNNNDVWPACANSTILQNDSGI